jgi:glucokinase
VNRLAIGVDIGGTKISAGVVDDGGELLRRAELPSDLDDPASVCRQISELTRDLGPEGAIGLGIGAAGVIDFEAGHYVFGPNTSLRDFDLASMTEEIVGLPVKIDNDANCAAWAEHRFGVGKGCKHFLCITLGTGIGGGLVLDGRPYRGAHGGAGEVGHMVVDRNGPRCGCGQNGCWEQLASGLALERIAREAYGRQVRGPDVTKAARAGDDVARKLVDELAHWVGWGIGSLVNILEPERIAIAGGIARDWDLLADVAKASMIERMEASESRPRPELLAAKMGHDAGIVGAALLALDAA